MVEGLGSPSAMQIKVTALCSKTVVSSGPYMITGGTVEKIHATISFKILRALIKLKCVGGYTQGFT